MHEMLILIIIIFLSERNQTVMNRPISSLQSNEQFSHQLYKSEIQIISENVDYFANQNNIRKQATSENQAAALNVKVQATKRIYRKVSLISLRNIHFAFKMMSRLLRWASARIMNRNPFKINNQSRSNNTSQKKFKHQEDMVINSMSSSYYRENRFIQSRSNENHRLRPRTNWSTFHDQSSDSRMRLHHLKIITHQLQENRRSTSSSPLFVKPNATSEKGKTILIEESHASKKGSRISRIKAQIKSSNLYSNVVAKNHQKQQENQQKQVFRPKFGVKVKRFLGQLEQIRKQLNLIRKDRIQVPSYAQSSNYYTFNKIDEPSNKTSRNTHLRFPSIDSMRIK